MAQQLSRLYRRAATQDVTWIALPREGNVEMRDPRCWREVYLRGGIMAIVSAVAFFMLDAEPWIWLLPVVVVAMVLAKWAVRPVEDDDEPPEQID